MKWAFSLVLVSILGACPAFAQGVPKDAEPPVMLEGITVTAAPLHQTDEGMEPAHKTRVQAEDFKERFTSVPEILSETVGVHITQFGGLGDFSTLSIRGSSSEQVLIYLDGFLLNAAQGGGVDLAKIPVSQIESIDVYRGAMPVTYGQTGIGGLVNIRTKQAAGEKKMAYQVQYGSFNTQRVNTTFSYKPGKPDLLLGLNYEKSDNDFEFLSDEGTPFTTSDDTIRRRRNAQFESLNVLGKFGYDLSTDHRIQFYANVLDTQKGVPGLGAFQSDTARLKTEHHQFGLRWEAEDGFGSGVKAQLELQHSTKHEVFSDRRGEVSVNGNTDNDNRTQFEAIHFNAEAPLGLHHTLKTRLQAREERFDPKDNLTGISGSTTRQRVYAVGLEDQIALLDDRLFLTPGLLYEDVRSRFKDDPSKRALAKPIPPAANDQFLSRQVGLLYRFSDAFSLRANLGRYFRRPNFFELFGDRGGTFGEIDLRPESGLNRDIGLRYDLRAMGLVRKLFLEAAYFDNKAEDLILFIQTSQISTRPENIAKSRTRGVELSGRLHLGARLRLESHYTYQRAKNVSDIPHEKNKFLPGRPVHDWFSKAAWEADLWGFYYSVNLTDENHLDRRNQREAASRKIHNVGLTLKSGPLWSLTLEAKNIGDDQIEDVFGFPLPGRSYFITLQGSI